MKRTIAAILCLVLVLGLFAGCQDNTPATQPNSTDPTYIMDYAWDAHSYCLFMNKEITAVLNQLSTHMLLCKQVNDGYSIDNALASAKASLDTIQEAKYQIEIMPPPAQYADNRENTLRMVELAEQDMKDWIEILEAAKVDHTKLTSLSDRMQADFIALTAEFNIYYN